MVDFRRNVMSFFLAIAGGATSQSVSAGSLLLYPDQGLAYQACAAGEGTFTAYWQNRYQTYTKTCAIAGVFDLGGGQGAANRYVHVLTPDNGYPLSSNGYAWKISTYCSSRADSSVPISWQPSQTMCQTGCAYSQSGTAVIGGEPVFTYEPTGDVCKDPPPQPPPPPPFQSEKNLGDCPGNMCGNPINTGTGNKYQSETDIEGSGIFGFSRAYNSGADIFIPDRNELDSYLRSQH